MGWAPRLQSRDEFFGRYVGLTQDTSQRAHFDFAVHWDDTAFGTATHNDVASRLTELQKAEAFKRPNYGNSRDMRQLSVKETRAEANAALSREGHVDVETEDQALAGVMKPNLVRALIQRGALR